jgi:chromosome segregation ATPase
MKMNVARGARRRQAGRFFVYALVSIALISGLSGNAQTPQKNEASTPSETAIMQALLAEVRQLRQAVQHVAAVDVRVQLVLQQMQLEQQQLNRASLRLDDIRKQIADFSSHEAEVASNLQSTEARLTEEQDPKTVKELQEEQAQFKEWMTQQLPAREAQLRAQEADAATLLQNEQNRWQELSDQLSALTQTLATDSTGEPEGKHP